MRGRTLVVFPAFLRAARRPVGSPRRARVAARLDAPRAISKDYEGICAETKEIDMQRKDRQSELSRRDFHRLATAAIGGLLAGTVVGCGDTDRADKPTTKSGPTATPAGPTASTSNTPTATVAATAIAQHACRGLNECKSQGKDQKNTCAGQGNCYTVKHECAGQNDCKNEGGCGGTNGFNDCKGKGGCGHFPIESKTWTKAREHFEARMKGANKKIGAAPAAAT
jgi:hypothetical protein